MPLQRKPDKPAREPHECTPVPGEVGRFYVKSRSAAKAGSDETYIVDVLEKEQTDVGEVTGTCQCKGWQVRKTCSHLTDALAIYRDDGGSSDHSPGPTREKWS